MLVHYTHKDGKVVSVTLEQEATELKTSWAREASAFIQTNYPSLPLHKLLRCPINTAGPRAATLTLRVEVLESPDEGP
ncbi:MAG: hypothetical protein HY688_03460 [Chloroflexi bacterium]|nr:hypothetical protein [Chloroflexota bacterium]